MLWSRRQLGMLGTGLLLPRRLLAQQATGRRFLFIFCNGGWDQTTVFAPLFDTPYVDMASGGEAAEAGGITFVDAEDRPAVRSFFEDWGAETCLLNGFEVPAISHDQCIRLVQAGRRTDNGDDWAAIMAGEGGAGQRMPYMVVSGPAFSNRFSSTVVRIGQDRQLAYLLDGSALALSDLPVSPLADPAHAAAEAFLQQRAAQLEAAARAGQAGRFADNYARALDDLAAVRSGVLDELTETKEAFTSLSSALEVALLALAAGETRCALIEDNGLWAQGWDTHQEHEYQALNFDLLFENLGGLMKTLSERTDADGVPLLETTTVVVFSEMGRQPKLNSHGGKHHWTSTSAMFLGAGIAGGQVIGGFDEYSLSLPMDFSTGAPTDSGDLPDVDDFGATLLALADIDPGPYTYGTPIGAVLR